MTRNLTLALEEDVLRAARKVALDRNTSVNQMVRDYLVEIAEQADPRTLRERKAAAARLNRFFRTSQLEVGPITWTRDDLHER